MEKLPILQTDFSGLCLAVSDEFCAEVGVNVSDLRGQFWLKIVHPDDRTRVMNSWDEAVARRLGFTLQFRTNTGREFSLDTLPVMVTPGAGKTPEIALVVLRASGGASNPSHDVAVPPAETAEFSGALSTVEQLTEQVSLMQQVVAAKRYEVLTLREQYTHDLTTAHSTVSELQRTLSEERQQPDGAMVASITTLQGELTALRGSYAAQERRLAEALEAVERERTGAEDRRGIAARDAEVARELVRELRQALDQAQQEREVVKQALAKLSTELAESKRAAEELYRTNGELSSRLAESDERHQRALTELRERLTRAFQDELAATQAETSGSATRVRDRSEDELPPPLLAGAPVPDDARVEPPSDESIDTVVRTVAEILEVQARASGIPFISALQQVGIVVPIALAAKFRALLHTLGEALLMQVGSSPVSFTVQSAEQTFSVQFKLYLTGVVVDPILEREAAALGLRITVASTEKQTIVQCAPPHIASPATSTNERTEPVVPTPEDSPVVLLQETVEAPELKPRVLIAEDNALNQRLLTKLLNEMGFDVAVAQHGREVFEQLAKGMYAAILMDCQMPVMDGYQATAGIRSQEKKAPQRRYIIGMSAHVDTDSEERCRAAGMDAFVTKPVQRAALEALLARFLRVNSR